VSSITKSADIPYTAEQMYELVNGIESYPEFLPWCTESKVFEREATHLKASVSLATGKIRQTFTTENHMQPGRRIDVKLVSGPFKHLQGYWKFEDTGDRNCHIELFMDFEFKNKLLKLTLKPVFKHFLNSLVGSFTKRAETIYGRGHYD
jgi:ribosome-associated toxin RatA of RatAB toxin-antitoxin module